ncbi:ABC transporter permease [Microbacterium sp. Root61]|uniref:ABC transporter permease n=1 Tax=Microbacterium sp. Root61 TaxID=1736570 RepID=UPI001F15CB2C|nr:ABC transporter permease [Microbacterium sp. Root61]
MTRPTFTLSAIIVVWWMAVAIGWRWLDIDPFINTGARLAPPSAEHWFGTDRIGRDVFARVLAGAESALLIGPLGTALATVLGTSLGLVAGFHRGWVDQLLMRVFDVFVALPAVLFLLIIVGAFGSSPAVLAFAIGVLFAPGIARVVRAAVLVDMGKDYVPAARSQGEGSGRILLTELLPNVWPQALVQATVTVAAAVFVAASLSFLGLAAAPPSPDWGLAVNENRAYLQGAWWTLAFPALAIASLVVSITLIGDNLKEVLRR